MLQVGVREMDVLKSLGVVDGKGINKGRRIMVILYVGMPNREQSWWAGGGHGSYKHKGESTVMIL